MPATLGYWDCRGLGNPIRYLLTHVGADFEEKFYKCGPPPTFDRGEWLSDKFNLKLDFPNLPYYMDDKVKLTQSAVIMRYLAKKYGLVGNNDVDEARCELLVNQAYDCHMEYARIVYNPDFHKLKDDYAKTVPDKMKHFSKFLGNHKYVAGDYLTYADFHFFEYLEGQLYFNKDALNDFPNLDQYHKRIMSLESIDKYFKSPKAIKFPFNGAPAFFGGAYSDQLK